MRADLGLAAGAATDSQGGVEQTSQHGVAAAGCRGGRKGAAHLSENLGLADHQRLDAGGDAEQMLHGLGAVLVVERDTLG